MQLHTRQTDRGHSANQEARRKRKKRERVDSIGLCPVWSGVHPRSGRRSTDSNAKFKEHDKVYFTLSFGIWIGIKLIEIFFPEYGLSGLKSRTNDPCWVEFARCYGFSLVEMSIHMCVTTPWVNTDWACCLWQNRPAGTDGSWMTEDACMYAVFVVMPLCS